MKQAPEAIVLDQVHSALYRIGLEADHTVTRLSENLLRIEAADGSVTILKAFASNHTKP